MLLCQNRGRHKHGYLPAIHHGFECGAQSNFRFAIAHITAQQAVHWAGTFHVPFDIENGAFLIFGFHVRETIFEFFLPLRIGMKE